MSCSNRKPFTLNRHTLRQTNRSIYKREYKLYNYIHAGRNESSSSKFVQERRAETPPKPAGSPENHREMRRKIICAANLHFLGVPSVSLPGFFGGVMQRYLKLQDFLIRELFVQKKNEVKSHFCYGKDGCFLPMDFFGFWVILDVLRKRWLEKMVTTTIPQKWWFFIVMNPMVFRIRKKTSPTQQISK